MHFVHWVIESSQGSVTGAIRHADPVGGSIQSILLLDSS